MRTTPEPLLSRLLELLLSGQRAENHLASHVSVALEPLGESPRGTNIFTAP